MGREDGCRQPVDALRPSTGTSHREGSPILPAVLGSQGSGVSRVVRREQGMEGGPAALFQQGLCSDAVSPMLSRGSRESSVCP